MNDLEEMLSSQSPSERDRLLQFLRSIPTDAALMADEDRARHDPNFAPVHPERGSPATVRMMEQMDEVKRECIRGDIERQQSNLDKLRESLGMPPWR